MDKKYIHRLPQIEKAIDKDIANLERILSEDKTFYEKSQICLGRIRSKLVYGANLIQNKKYSKGE